MHTHTHTRAGTCTRMQRMQNYSLRIPAPHSPLHPHSIPLPRTAVPLAYVWALRRYADLHIIYGLQHEYAHCDNDDKSTPANWQM